MVNAETTDNVDLLYVKIRDCTDISRVAFRLKNKEGRVLGHPVVGMVHRDLGGKELPGLVDTELLVVGMGLLEAGMGPLEAGTGLLVVDIVLPEVGKVPLAEGKELPLLDLVERVGKLQGLACRDYQVLEEMAQALAGNPPDHCLSMGEVRFAER